MTTAHKQQYSQLLDTHNKTPVNCVDTNKIFNNNSPHHRFTVPRCTLLLTTQSQRQSTEATIPFSVFFPPCCLTTTESVGIIRDGSPGRPSPLSLFLHFLSSVLLYVHRDRRTFRDRKPRSPTSSSKKAPGSFFHTSSLSFFNVALRPQRP